MPHYFSEFGFSVQIMEWCSGAKIRSAARLDPDGLNPYSTNGNASSSFPAVKTMPDVVAANCGSVTEMDPRPLYAMGKSYTGVPPDIHNSFQQILMALLNFKEVLIQPKLSICG